MSNLHPASRPATDPGDALELDPAWLEGLDEHDAAILAWREAAASPAEGGEARGREERRVALRSALDLLEPLAKRYYDFYTALRPSGADGRDYEAERAAFIDRFPGDPSYAPTFVYTHARILDGASAEVDARRLRELRTSFARLGDPHVRGAALAAVESTEHVFRLFAATRAGDDDAFQSIQHEMFGGVTAGSLRAAKAIAATRRPVDAPTGTASMDALTGRKFRGPDLAAFFRRSLELRGLADRFEIVVVPAATTASVHFFPAKGGKPQVKVPGEKELNGLELLALEAHEIGVHAVTSANSQELGMNATLGWGYELLSEGQGLWRSLSLRSQLTGTPPDFRRVEPVYAIGLDAIERGANFREAFDLMFAAHMGRLAEGADVRKEAATVYDRCTRIFRGVTDLRAGGRGFFKDKCYLQGVLHAQRFAAAGVGDVPCRGRFDPLRPDDVIALGVMDVEPAFDAGDGVRAALADEVRDGRLGGTDA